jgi:superfamily I DNA/RNA helicase
MPLYVWLDQLSDKILLDENLTQYAQVFPDDVAEYRNLRKITRPGDILGYMTLHKFLDMTRGVQLTTIHSSKGMGFEVVIITGVERIWDDENGKRLLYVAITRAERDVCLIYSKVRPGWNPSTPPYIEKIRKKCGYLPFVKHFSSQ